MDAHQVSHHASLQGKAVRRLLRRGGRGRIGKLLAKMRTEDVAFMLRGFTPAEQFDVFRILASDFADEAPSVLLELDPPSRLGILEQLEPSAIAGLIAQVASDDAVFLLDSLPDALREEVLAIVDVETEKFSDLQAQLVYADDTAGRIMDNEFVALVDSTTVAEATEQIREVAQDIEMISYLYVVDDLGRLVGVTPLRNLLLAQPKATLRELMNPSVIHVHTATDQEEVAQLASRYDLLAIPVTDEDDHLVGIVTIDDIVDIVKAEATEDFYKMAGTSDDELIYEDKSWKIAGIRLPWILFNLVGLLLAGVVVGRFETAFESGLSVAVLVGFIPVIMGMAGNIGAQTSTIAVRGLATGRLQVTAGEVRRFTWQQLKVGVILGVVCSTLVAIAAVFLGESLVIPAAVGLSLFFTVQLASLNGVLIPVLFDRLGFDPAVASGPLVTTSNDVLGVLIYFSLTAVLFGWLGA
ncbi:MAG: magnesium transporter [Acidobacteriota bacterium]